MKKDFTIKVNMEERWISHFCSMLKAMERYGNLGRSEIFAIYSDGDGDFRPKFEFDINIEEAQPVTDWNPKEEHKCVLFDAG